MIGQLVLQQYKIETKIGAGGMGEVYKALDVKLNDRPVVLKFPLADEALRKQLMLEANALLALNHPNIVTIYNLDEWQSRLFICMEYVVGQNLAKLREEKAINLALALDIIVQVMEAVWFAHRGGILHRDLKPSNIMIRDDGYVKVLDFGIAKFINTPSLTQSSFFKGTIPYAAPEAFQNALPKESRDIFAIGVVLYELLANELPFPGENADVMINAILYQPPVPLRGVPVELVAIIMKALEKEPQKRYQNLGEMLAAIERFQKKAPIKSQTEQATFLTIRRTHLETVTKSLALEKPLQGENPYRDQEVIRNPDDFYGRKSEIQQIYAALATTPRPLSVAIVGERHIGKSSLLNYLYHPENRAKYLANPEAYIFAMVDMHATSIVALKDLFAAIINAIRQEFPENFKPDCSPDYPGLRSLGRFLEAKGLRLIILFDGFEKIVANPLFDRDFFSFLRNLVNKHEIAFIVTAAKNWRSLCHSPEIAVSPFFENFTVLNLGVFKPEEARELICAPSQAAGYSLEPLADDILKIAGVFPAFLQTACSVIFALIQSGQKRDAALLHETQKLFLAKVETRFQAIWENLTPAEQALVVKILRGKKPSTSEDELAEKLCEASCLIRQNGQLRLFSETFAEYLRQNLGLGSFWKKFRWWKK